MFYWSAVAAAAALAALVTAGFVVRRRLEHTSRDASAPQPPAGGWVQAFIGPYRLPLLLALALVLTATLVDLLVPWSLKVLIDNVVGGDPLPPFLSDLSGLTQHQLAFGAAATGLLLVLVNVVLTYLVTYLVGATENLIAADMRAVVFRRLQDLSLRFHDRNRTGDLVSRLTDDVGRVRDAIIAWFESVAPDALTLVGILIIVTIIDPFLTVVSLSVIPLLIYYAFTKRPVIKAAERSARDRRGELATHATDTLRNVRLVQAFSRQRMETDRFRRQLDQTANAEIMALDVSARYSPIGSVVLAIGTALVSWIGVVRVVDGRLSLGTLVVFLSYLSGLYGPIRSLSRLVSTFAKGAASRERLVELFDDTHIVRDDPGAVEAGTAATRLVLRDLRFGYEAAAPVLRQVNLTVEPGETVCIVGASGVGKSTLLSLLLRLYEPTAGAITLGGIDIQQLTMESLREHVALVPQAPWIIDGTIGDNILFGRADATDAEFRHATRKALVDEFTARLPRGLDTQVGESGVLLSGGQLRRVALARAVIRNSPVLLLDEPTAGLDAESVAEVMSALTSVGDDRTMVVVSHDLRLAEQADRVAVMVDGTIVESGTHQALLDSQGRYAAMWMIQRDISDLTIPVGNEREKEVNTL